MSHVGDTVTFLFTDIEGSTRLWQLDPDAMRAAVARHDALLRQVLTEHDGAVFSTMGDGLAAAFQSATAAVAAALDAQIQLGAEGWPTPSPIRVRMGLHTGEAEFRDGDYFGISVNRAARLTAVGHGGQVLCSAATAGLVDAEVPLIDLGEHQLRDIGRPLRVFQVGGGEFGFLRSAESGPARLPVPSSTLVGRDGELATLAEALREARLVTVVGVGGVGKTRLALEVARHASDAYADGVSLVELAAVSSADGLVDAVMAAVGAIPALGPQGEKALLTFLSSKEMLVVLDNCEHLLWPVADLVEALLARSEGSAFLATSREPLGVAGERVMHLASLRPPRGDDLGDVVASPAVELFCLRAMEAGAPIVLQVDNAATVAAICRRLDGIPLALELAAARARSMPLAELERRLDDTFRLLVGTGRGAVERHQTLRRTVEWSYSLLTDTEQVVFERVSVFPAGFSLESAEAVVEITDGDRTVDGSEVADALGALVDKSLVFLDRDSGRYRLLETLRLFAAEHLAMAGEADRARQAHARWCVQFFAHCSRQAFGDDLDWLQQAATEGGNLGSAAMWAAATRDVDLAAELLPAMYLDRSRTYDQPQRALIRAITEAPLQICADRRRVALAHASFDLQAFDRERGRALAEATLAEEEDARDFAAGVAHEALSLYALIEGRPEKVERHFLEARTIFYGLVEAGTVDGLTLTFAIGQASKLAFAGRIEAARQAAEEAVAFAESTGSRMALHDGRLELGIVLVEAGDYARALPLLESGTLGSDVPVRSHCWNAMARARARVGGPGGFEGYRAAITRHHETGDEYFGLVNCLRYLSSDLEGIDPETAARLDGWNQGRTLLIASRHRDQRDETVSRLQTRLGSDRLMALQDEGRRMGTDDVVRCAFAAIGSV